MIQKSAYRIRPWKPRKVTVVVQGYIRVYNSKDTGSGRAVLSLGEYNLREIPNPVHTGGDSWFVDEEGKGCTLSEWEAEQEVGKVVIK